MARLKKVSSPVIGETYMVNKKGWKKVTYIAQRGDDYRMQDSIVSYPWEYLVTKGDIYVWDINYTRQTPQN